jgi:hypothetical protein
MLSPLSHKRLWMWGEVAATLSPLPRVVVAII